MVRGRYLLCNLLHSPVWTTVIVLACLPMPIAQSKFHSTHDCYIRKGEHTGTGQVMFTCTILSPFPTPRKAIHLNSWNQTASCDSADPLHGALKLQWLDYHVRMDSFAKNKYWVKVGTRNSLDLRQNEDRFRSIEKYVYSLLTVRPSTPNLLGHAIIMIHDNSTCKLRATEKYYFIFNS